MRVFVLVIALFASLVPVHANASAPPNAVAVLDREAQWLAAISRGDAKTLGTILAENYVHTDYKGNIEYREGALANIARHKAYLQKTSEQTVDFAGNAAVVHGINTVSLGGKVVMRLRYTDVYVKDGSGWKVLSAQETPITAR